MSSDSGLYIEIDKDIENAAIIFTIDRCPTFLLWPSVSIPVTYHMFQPEGCETKKMFLVSEYFFLLLSCHLMMVHSCIPHLYLIMFSKREVAMLSKQKVSQTKDLSTGALLLSDVPSSTCVSSLALFI